MSENCIKHPNEPTFKYDPFCESIWCKECYDRLNQIYEQCYKSENDSWLTRETIIKEQAKKFWPDKDFDSD